MGILSDMYERIKAMERREQERDRFEDVPGSNGTLIRLKPSPAFRRSQCAPKAGK